MATTILKTENGDCYIEQCADHHAFTDGPYSVRVAKGLAPGAPVHYTYPWHESMQRAICNASE